MDNKTSQDKIKAIFLDRAKCMLFRDTVNSSPIFIYDKEVYKSNNNIKKSIASWNLICSVIDRIDGCVKFLNENSYTFPLSEEDFIGFLSFSAILYNAIKCLFEQLGIDYPYNEETNSESFKYFKDVYKQYVKEYRFWLEREDVNTINCNELENYPTDDKFFEYLRSLAFAHPFDTSRPKFFLKDENQYSPWVIANIFGKKEFGGDIGVRIYSNKFDGILDLRFDSSILRDYIKSRYDLINKATEWAQNSIKKYKILWAQRKVNRELSPIEILKDIKDILHSRYEFNDHIYFIINDAIEFLSCKLTDSSNFVAVEKYRNYLISLIPSLCDCIDSVDQDSYNDHEFVEAISIRPERVDSNTRYQLEKIFCKLKVDGEKSADIKFALNMVESFSKGFAKDYVTIDKNILFSEIKLLVTTACYLEKMNQENGNISSVLRNALQDEESTQNQLRLRAMDSMQSGKATLYFVDCSYRKNE